MPKLLPRRRKQGLLRRAMADWVMDASAILAFIKQEPGGDKVAPLLGSAAVSANNLAEIVARLWERGLKPTEIRTLIDSLGIEVHSVDQAQAFEIGALRPLTRSNGLSLGDRSCLALARKLGLPVVTADRAWSGLTLDGIEIRQIR